MSALQELDAKIRSVCPIDGVCGDGFIFFQDIATLEQRAAAMAIMNSYDPASLAQSDFVDGIQNHIDAVARSKGYKDGFALAGYSSSTIPAWSGEASTFIAWRDAVWVYAYAQLSAVESAHRSPPASVEALILELPDIDWGA